MILCPLVDGFFLCVTHFPLVDGVCIYHLGTKINNATITHLTYILDHPTISGSTPPLLVCSERNDKEIEPQRPANNVAF
uniref:Putative secreted peptide n=1 Tax=Anopheles braziliensis TaxID=58242 RepID=A0A2M3ZTW2_9DIPT